MCHLPPLGRLFYISLWNFADDFGRGRALPKELVGFAFPADEDIEASHVKQWLKLLSDMGCITLYDFEGLPCFQINNWGDHQKTEKPTPSRFPAPMGYRQSLPEASPNKSGTTPQSLPEASPNESGTYGGVGNRNQEIGNRNQEIGGESRTGARGDEPANDIPPSAPLKISAEAEARQTFGFTPNLETPSPKPAHPDPASPYPLKLYQQGAAQGYSLAEIREAGRIAHEERGVSLGGTFASYASKCLPKARENLANKPTMPPPIDPEEAKRAKALREAERAAWEAEQLADLDRKIENGRRKREERERNEQATATA